MQVTIYTTSTCQYCSAEKQYLDGLKIPHTTVILDQDKTKLADMLIASGGFSGVPVTVLLDESGKQTVVKGFDRVKLDELLSMGQTTSTPNQQQETQVPGSEQAPFTPMDTLSAQPAETPVQPETAVTGSSSVQSERPVSAASV